MDRRTALTRIARAAAVAAWIGAGAGASAEVPVFPHPVHNHRLANGLRVVVVPFSSPGVVAFFTVVRTGSREEVEPGHSGFAHFFEHMMFRGTEKVSPEAYNDALKRMGADSNAFTTEDYTNYYIVGPAASLPTMMELEADRFKNLRYGEEAFKTEALAVLGEYNKSASSPFLPLAEKLQDLAFTRHTYKHTTMGFLADVQAMPGEYAYSLSFFDRFYRPENTVLLVVGDARADAVFALAERLYGDWKPGYQPAAIPAEPPQEGERRGHIDWPSPTRPYLVIGFRKPAFAPSRETAALDLVDQLLTSESAALYRELVVDRQWVDQFTGDRGYQRDPGLYTLTARIKSDDLVDDVEAAIREAVAELAAKPVAAERLARIKSHLTYGFALRLDSPGAVGFTVAEFLNLTGEVESIDRLYRAYAELTPEDVQTAAREVLRMDRATVVTLGHRPPAPPPPAAGTANPAAAAGGEGR